jgi:hypothetical protein
MARFLRKIFPLPHPVPHPAGDLKVKAENSGQTTPYPFQLGKSFE